MNERPVPLKAAPGLSLDEMKTFVINYFEDFVNQKKSEVALKNFKAYERFPDLHVTNEDILADGDKVMVRNTWHATEKLDNLIVGENGESRISMEDYAIALVDELEKHKHSKTRFSIGY